MPIVMLGELRQVEAEVERLKAENERLIGERDALFAACRAVLSALDCRNYHGRWCGGCPECNAKRAINVAINKLDL
jgi:hypothetical protein